MLGVLHFVRPRPFERIVPKPLPRKRELVYASGVAELACAAGLLHPLEPAARPVWPARCCSLCCSRRTCRWRST